LQLRECLTGEAFKFIENLGYSSTAYEAAKEKVWWTEKADCYVPRGNRSVKVGNTRARDPEKLADLLNVAIVNLKEANQFDKLKNGLMHAICYKKSYLPQC